MLEWVRFMKGTHANDVVNFDLKGTRVCCVVNDSTDYKNEFR